MMPKPTPKDLATAQDYYHCIDLTEGRYWLKIKGVSYPNADLKELLTMMEKNQKEIKSQKLSLITDGDRYSEVVDVLDKLQLLGIDNYKLLGANEVAEYPLVIQSPVYSEKTIGINDPEVLQIWIQTDTLSATFQNNSARGKITDMERFLVENKKKIDPDKIIIASTGNTRFPEFEAVTQLLRKYGYEKWRLKVKEE